jgi:hypothetical protein
VGFGALIGAVPLVPVFWLGSLLLAPAGLLALRGCPSCWATGLMQTVSMGRMRRSCVDGRYELTVVGRARSHQGDDRRPGESVASVAQAAVHLNCGLISG